MQLMRYWLKKHKVVHKTTPKIVETKFFAACARSATKMDQENTKNTNIETGSSVCNVA